ncbi:hypothetical protein Tco_1334694, partial [Tanacetum coccineum]
MIEVHNDKPCTKSCLKNYESLKKQYDDLVAKKHETEFKAIIYKRGLDTIETQLVTYRKNEVLFSKEVTVLKRDVGIKQYEINTLKTEFEKLKQEKDAIDFKIEKFDWVSDNEDEVESPVVVEKKIVVHTIPKVDVVRPKQQEKPVRKTVRKPVRKTVCGSFDHLKKDFGKRIIKPVWKNTRRVNDHYSTRMTHSNLRRNMIPQAVLIRSGIKVVNTAKPKDAHNAVKRNRFNAVKA